MSKKLTTKNAIEVALTKDIEAPDEATGLVLYRASVNIKDEDDEFSQKRALTEKDLMPTDAEMDLINASARMTQDPNSWYVFRNVNVTGPLGDVDSHGDMFSLKAAKTMADQVTPQEASPIITDHWHDLGDKPPVGKAIMAKASSKGLIETWAIPKEDYNANIVKGLLNGTINKISIGAFISPSDKICNSCGTKSIYSMDCPHIPLRNDEKGNLVTVTIKDVKRYAERSLVNIPARLGTSVKSLAPESLTEAYEKAKEDSISKEMAPNYDHLKETFQSFPTPSDIGKVVRDVLEAAFDGPRAGETVISMGKSLEGVHPTEDNGSPATITPVINEKESSVSEVDNKNVEAPEAQEPSEKQETAPAEAAASEEATAPEQEVKSVEVPVIKELELEELTKSFKLEVEPVTKALAEVNEKFVQLNELQEKNAKDLGALTEIVTKLAQHVEALGNFSSEDVLNQVVELVAQLKDQKATEPINKAPENFSDFVSSLVAKK